ncbi:MAG: DUF4367 domain-containing protein [Oscillospiraceae bacterium]|nr:DUF4367 domain-containing protein [Oscillospiraceae bacterium]
MMSNVSDDNFKNAVSEALLSEYTDMLPEQCEEHIFSRKFEKKMSRLIKRRNKIYYPFINNTFKRTAVAIGALVIASTVSVVKIDALREVFVNIKFNIFEKYSVITPADDKQVPETIEDIYEITYDLSGYEVVYEMLDNTKNCIEYLKDDISIDFTQYVKDTSLTLNTENANIENVMINKIEAIYFIDYKGYHYLTWDNGDYLFCIITNTKKETLFDIAESVKVLK